MWLVMVFMTVSSCSNQSSKPEHIEQNSHSVSLGSYTVLNSVIEPPSDPSFIQLGMKSKEGNSAVDHIRYQALKNASLAYGSQHGFQRRVWEINSILELRGPAMSHAFDFNRVVAYLPQNRGIVIPPVIAHASNAQQLNHSNTELATVDEYLTIMKPGRLSTAIPTYIDYLIIPVVPPEVPPDSLMPRDVSETTLFRKWFNEGWLAGQEQGDAEFSSRLNRLLSEYKGMQAYRLFVELGLVDNLALAQEDFGVTGDARILRIGDRNVQFISFASFQADPTQWNIMNHGNDPANQ